MKNIRLQLFFHYVIGEDLNERVSKDANTVDEITSLREKNVRHMERLEKSVEGEITSLKCVCSVDEGKPVNTVSDSFSDPGESLFTIQLTPEN